MSDPGHPGRERGILAGEGSALTGQGALDTYLSRHRVGEVLGSRADISWGPDVLLSPDVFVAPLEQVRTLDWSRM